MANASLLVFVAKCQGRRKTVSATKLLFLAPDVVEMNGAPAGDGRESPGHKFRSPPNYCLQVRLCASAGTCGRTTKVRRSAATLLDSQRPTVPRPTTLTSPANQSVRKKRLVQKLIVNSICLSPIESPHKPQRRTSSLHESEPRPQQPSPQISILIPSQLAPHTAATMSSKYAFTKTLKEVRFLFCQTSEQSAAMRYVVMLRTPRFQLRNWPAIFSCAANGQVPRSDSPFGASRRMRFCLTPIMDALLTFIRVPQLLHYPRLPDHEEE